MYPLSNVLGNSLTDSYGEGYHYDVVEGDSPFPRVTSLICDASGGGDTTPDRPPPPTMVHLQSGFHEIADPYTNRSQSQGSDGEFGIDHPNLDEFAPTTPAPLLIWDCTTCGLGKVEEGSRCTTSGCEGCRRPIKRRNTANKKERRRTQSINNAFTELRDCIPNVPSDTKLSMLRYHLFH